MPIRIITPDTNELWQAYLACRFRALYEPFGLPRSCTVSELDSPPARPDILHRAALLDGQLVAVGRLDLQPHHPQGPSSQLRYFALEAHVRGRGIAQALLIELESLSRQNNLPRLWMEARVAALNFYLRHGYADIGPGPNKWGIIPHRTLARTLT